MTFHPFLFIAAFSGISLASDPFLDGALELAGKGFNHMLPHAYKSWNIRDSNRVNADDSVAEISLISSLGGNVNVESEKSDFGGKADLGVKYFSKFWEWKAYLNITDRRKVVLDASDRRRLGSFVLTPSMSFVSLNAEIKSYNLGHESSGLQRLGYRSYLSIAPLTIEDTADHRSDDLVISDLEVDLSYMAYNFDRFAVLPEGGSKETAYANSVSKNGVKKVHISLDAGPIFRYLSGDLFPEHAPAQPAPARGLLKRYYYGYNLGLEIKFNNQIFRIDYDHILNTDLPGLGNGQIVSQYIIEGSFLTFGSKTK